jgi:hypothetical protein
VTLVPPGRLEAGRRVPLISLLVVVLVIWGLAALFS